MAGIYLHIPFCKKKCHYCNFHFSTTYEKYRERMIQAMLQEIRQQKSKFNFPIHTIYFGGGTPSLLSPTEILAFIKEIKLHFKVASDAEITLEANPDDITPELALLWFQNGINRLSIGIQSFFQENLVAMNRAHNQQQAIDAVKMIRDAGFTNFSIDLMFALPGLSDEMWRQNLQTAIDLKVPHLSCYNLTIEEQSTLIQLIKQKKMPELSEQSSVAQFKIAMEMLEKSGYHQYEISNYALPGKESKHNSAYWDNQEYLGIGPSAHSYWKRKRYYNVANNTKYIKGIEENLPISTTENLTPENIFNEYILTQLRTSKGVNLAELELLNPSFFKLIQKILQKLQFLKKVQISNDQLTLTQDGKFIADQISSELFV